MKQNKLITITKFGGGYFFISRGFSDILKSIACVVIALHHYSQNIIITEGANNLLYFLFSTQGGYSGVALFFFLSGYGLMESESCRHLGLWAFLKKRIWKVYKPVFIVNLIVFLSCLLWNYCETKSWECELWYEVFLIDKMDWYFWFVAVLMNCYVLFGLCSQVRLPQMRTFCMIIFILVLCCIYIILDEPVGHWISIPFFGIGALCSEYKIEISSLIRQKMTWATLLLLCLFLLYYSRMNGMMILTHVAVNIMQTFLLIFIASTWIIEIGISAALSGLSYPIYLVHHKFIQLPLWLGNMLPVWIFLLLTFYMAWLFNKTMGLMSVNSKK